MLIKVLCMSCPLSHVCKGKRAGEDPTKLYSHSHPQVGRNKERADENILGVSEDKLFREVLSFAQKERKIEIGESNILVGIRIALCRGLEFRTGSKLTWKDMYKDSPLLRSI
jgi:hypothetical protein